VPYYKPANQPELILKRRTDPNDHEMLARAWQAAEAKVRSSSPEREAGSAANAAPSAKMEKVAARRVCFDIAVILTSRDAKTASTLRTMFERL
jgi:hypothetical protein